MTIEIIYKIIPVPVFYVENMDHGGRSLGLAVLIRKRNKGDQGLLEHELQHCRQAWRTCFMSGILMAVSKKWRYRFELECYRLQLEYSEPRKRDADARLFAGYLANNYDLDITPAQALIDLMS